MSTIRSKAQRSHTAFDRHRAVLVGRWGRAGADFVAATSDATQSFGHFLSIESQQWWDYLRAELTTAPSLLRSVRDTPLERELLLQLARLLETLRGKVDERLRQLGQAGDSVEAVDLPLPDYPTLTARAIVARAGQLSAEQRTILRDYESRHKRRATVLRALEPRAAA